MILELAYSPARAFDRLKDTDFLKWSVILLAVRWIVSAANTLTNMYLHHSPMAIRPPFGIEKDTYRFYEIFWYGPYGVLIMLTIVLALFLIGKRYYRNHHISFRKTFEIVSLSFFTPWLPTVPGDYLLILTVNARPEFLVPFHVIILSWECWLVSLGFRRIFGVEFRQSAFLALVAGGLFFGLGGLLIR